MQNVRHNLTGLYGWNKKYLKHPERFTLNPLTFFFGTREKKTYPYQNHTYCTSRFILQLKSS